MIYELLVVASLPLKKMKSIELKPELEELHRLNDFIIDEFNLDNPSVSLIIEEIFVNIVNYSNCSRITAEFELENELFTMLFRDDGLKFNPLNASTPKLPDTIEKTPIGGLGIYLVKHHADKIEYEYTDNENKLRITKNVRS